MRVQVKRLRRISTPSENTSTKLQKQGQAMHAKACQARPVPAKLPPQLPACSPGPRQECQMPELFTRQPWRVGRRGEVRGELHHAA